MKFKKYFFIILLLVSCIFRETSAVTKETVWAATVASSAATAVATKLIMDMAFENSLASNISAAAATLLCAYLVYEYLNEKTPESIYKRIFQDFEEIKLYLIPNVDEMSFEQIEYFVNSKMIEGRWSKLTATCKAILTVIEEVKPSPGTVKKFKSLKSKMDYLAQNIDKFEPYFNYIVDKKEIEKISDDIILKKQDVVRFAKLEFGSDWPLIQAEKKLKSFKVQIQEMIKHCEQSLLEVYPNNKHELHEKISNLRSNLISLLDIVEQKREDIVCSDKYMNQLLFKKNYDLEVKLSNALKKIDKLNSKIDRLSSQVAYSNHYSHQIPFTFTDKFQ